VNPRLAASPPRIGPYEVFGRLADGTESVVWAATSRRGAGFVRTHAIKCLKATAAGKRLRKAAFAFEAAIGGAIDHPNLLAVQDVGSWDGRPYLVTDLVRGWNLRSILATADLTRTPIPLAAVLAIIHAAAEGVHYLHELVGHGGRPLRLIHRAVDDTNLMVARAGFVKLLDYGFAGPVHAEPMTPITGRAITDFTAPELIGHRQVDRRADVYGLGVALARLGERMPFECPDDLRSVLARATADRARDRFSSARDLQRALEAVALARDVSISASNTARLLDRLFSPTNRPDQTTLPGLEGARLAPRKVVPNAGRTRVRVTRGGPSQVSGLRYVQGRPRRHTTGC
jgi:serine/threonine protein kinase